MGDSENGEIRRGLKSRHVQLIALGGCIGTGLFVGSGSALSQTGPAALLLGYAIMSCVIYFVMNILGEMGTWLPIPGAGSQHFIGAYLDPSLGVAAGWNYWYSYAVLVMAEVSAAGLVVQYWTDKVHIAVWITIFLAVIIALNFVAVEYYGESEFWFASLKIICILGLLVTGVVIFFGGAPTHDRIGFRYWKNPGPFVEHLTTGAAGRFCAVWTSLVKAGYAFIFSPELVTTAAGETEAPRRNIPKGVRRFIYRIVFLYISSVVVIGCIVPSNDPHLLSAIDAGASTAAASPFVIGIQNAGIPVLNHIVNGVILTSAWSSGNSFMYAGSRSLYSMARDGYAPQLFSKCNKFGVPYYAVGATSVFSLLAYLNVSSSGAEAFGWFSNISTISGFIAWIFAAAAHTRWRRAITFQGLDDRVPFRTPLQPYGSWFLIVFMSILTLTNGYAVFIGGNFNAGDFVASYISIPVFFGIYAAHKTYLYFKTGYTRFLIPIAELDLTTGLDDVEAEEAATPERIPNNIWEKFWYWLA
ncbi:hypothetical protein BABINDRAFT_180027 [Babjeviella inositovora NRRL Y-12698]|uniref:Amino acid permease/ SLC12A domain-containing protein n=1 Tax=Babjeviella inositovora NRRL Y-12698 TaxID=984486 RepID=A0A1E3QSV5_9ASCO|nr:uncharacterized protein BABINDRAFT_180027 [Babjeviella inositovora NRRL Y-12698]ODQ80795.1 hypothetical protein BABINDRAFT_180027 [Babjeviella inositovora NRRL Y-12698]